MGSMKQNNTGKFHLALRDNWINTTRLNKNGLNFYLGYFLYLMMLSDDGLMWNWSQQKLAALNLFSILRHGPWKKKNT